MLRCNKPFRIPVLPVYSCPFAYSPTRKQPKTSYIARRYVETHPTIHKFIQRAGRSAWNDRHVGIVEAAGSNPVPSTTTLLLLLPKRDPVLSARAFGSQLTVSSCYMSQDIVLDRFPESASVVSSAPSDIPLGAGQSRSRPICVRSQSGNL